MARNGEWERVEPLLYRLKHQTPTGEWTTRYYVRFKDWKGVHRKFPAGTELRGARTKKKIVLGENERRVDFDSQKTQDITFAKWAETYLDRFAKGKRSYKDDVRYVRICSEFFGPLLLSNVTRTKVEEFKQLRKNRQTWRGDPVSSAYCNRELGCLRHIFKLAVEEGLLEVAPIVRMYKESNARDTALNEEEYHQLLAVAPKHLQRLITCAYETGMRAGEIVNLTWDKVDLKTGFIRLVAEDTKTNEKRAIPLSPFLRTTLEEIRKEQREEKIAALRGHVFTWQGKPIGRQGWKRSWATACHKVGLDGLHFHDLRHTFVTRKVREGWDYKRIMTITGHKTFRIFQRYNNPSEEDLREVVTIPPPTHTATVGKLLANSFSRTEETSAK
jgi:integrase